MTIKYKCNMNIKLYAMHLNGRKVRKTINIIIYKYKIFYKNNKLLKKILYITKQDNKRIVSYFKNKRQKNKKQCELYPFFKIYQGFSLIFIIALI